ncbi:MAG: permease-like cell division protein FtsX [Oscillospiraceae bacterium]|nr:permease-like cell division protein FtsX [Clostridiaceae bacterium]MDY5889420.1 permease-like cell division protein FtsX [Oscillospiraceae bacterium]MDY5935285.1 permease-like cell division protein FtsX [Oscillospiraceae bacterium]
MKKRRSRIGYLTKEGFRNIRVNHLMSIASIAVLMSCLVMMGAAFMVIVNVNNVMSEIESQNVVMVYLKEEVQGEAITEMREKITLMQNVKKCEFVDKETAFKQQLEELDTDATYFEGVENPLPDLFKVSVSDMTKFDKTVAELKTLDGVDSVRDNREIAQTLVKIRQTIFYVSIGVIAVLLLISLFIIANTVRITMYSRRLEINIMKSVGATNWFIRWPFMVEGMVLGAISGILSLAVVWGLYRLVQPSVSSMLTMVSRGFTTVSFLDYIVYILVAFLVIGIVSGGIGSLISIQKYLKERGGVVYEETE